MIDMYPCRLDMKGNIVATYQNFDSFVFNERYQKTGDFQLSSYDPDGLFKAFPLNSLMCSSVSNASMQCVKHDYTRDSNGNIKGVVSGVTPEAILRYRAAMPKIAIQPTMAAYEKGFTWGHKDDVPPTVDVLSVFKNLFSLNNNNYYSHEEFKKLQIPFFFQEFLSPTYGNQPTNESSINRQFKPHLVSMYEVRMTDTLYKVLEDAMKESAVDVTVQRIPGKTALNFVIRRPLYKADGIRFQLKHTLSETSSRSSETPNFFVSPTRDRVVVHDLSDSDMADPTLMGMNYRMVIRPIDAYTPEGKDQKDIEKYADDRLAIIEDYQNAVASGVEMNKSFVDNKFLFSTNRTNNTELYEYDLGDVVSIDSYMNGTSEMFISEYIRVQDTTGFKEYPVLKPFVTTDYLASPGSIVTSYFKKIMRSFRLYNWN